MKEKGKGAGVAEIHRAPGANVTLPDDFFEAPGFGVKRSDGTHAPRLVRLGDVVRWLQGDEARSRDEAVALILDKLRAEHWPSLAELDKGSARAKPLLDDERFGYPTQQAIADKLTKQRREAAQRALGASRNWVTMGGSLVPGVPRRWQDVAAPSMRRATGGGGSDAEPAPVAVAPGLPALVRLIGDAWGPTSRRPQAGAPDRLDDPRWRVAHLAVALPLAFDLWGLGHVAEAPKAPERKPGEPRPWAELVAYRLSAEASIDWSAEDVKRLQLERQARIDGAGGSVRGVTKGIADELDKTDAAINNQLKREVEYSKADGQWRFVEPGKREAGQRRRTS